MLAETANDTSPGPARSFPSQSQAGHGEWIVPGLGRLESRDEPPQSRESVGPGEGSFWAFLRDLGVSYEEYEVENGIYLNELRIRKSSKSAAVVVVVGSLGSQR
jgi:hypothetical protein